MSVRDIVFCNNCNKYIIPHNSKGSVYCSKCGEYNRNVEIMSIQVEDNQQEKLTQLLINANENRIKLKRSDIEKSLEDSNV